MATKEQALEASAKYFNRIHPAEVFVQKYALNKDGNYYETTPADSHKRVASEFARIESHYPNALDSQTIFNWLDGFERIVLQGSPYAGIGNNLYVTSISNCYSVGHPYDSYGGITTTGQEIVQIAKRRGGVGTSIQTIRPAGVAVRNAAKTSDGTINFVRRFAYGLEEVAQSGRRGAGMITQSIHHPESAAFITCKSDKSAITGVNISIEVTDEFMQAVEDDGMTRLFFEHEGKLVIDQEVPARPLFMSIVETAYNTAEPGLLFVDTIRRRTPSEVFPGFEYATPNPCGEILLNKYGSCNLMAMNLTYLVADPFTDHATINLDKLTEMARVATRLLDDQVDLEIEKLDAIISKIESDPEPEYIKATELHLWTEIKKVLINGRRLGLGILGLGDTFAMLGMDYGSEESIALTEMIYRKIALAAYEESALLAKERGAFPAYSFENASKSEFTQQIWEANPAIKEVEKEYGRRNIAILTTAPTGTVSMLAGVTSGIEPAMFLESIRKRRIPTEEIKEYKAQGRKITYSDAGHPQIENRFFHPMLEEWMKIKNTDSIEGNPWERSTISTIDWLQGNKIQAAAQRWVCHSISRTCNLPKSATTNDVAAIYMDAWKNGLKGITIYREGTRSGVVLDANATPTNTEFIEMHDAPRRPSDLPCRIYRVSVKGEKWVVMIGYLEGRAYEIFAGKATKIELPKGLDHGIIHKEKMKTKARYDLIVGTEEVDLTIDSDDLLYQVKDIPKVFDNPDYSVLTRLVSQELRHGVRPSFIVEQLQRTKDADMTSFMKVLARVLKSEIKDGEEVTGEEKKCPNCQGRLVYVEGCVTCTACGWSKCG